MARDPGDSLGWTFEPKPRRDDSCTTARRDHPTIRDDSTMQGAMPSPTGVTIR
jgi:hypothetical protein